MAQNTGKCIEGNVLYDYDNNLKYELTRVPTADDPGEATLTGFIDKDNATTELVLENKIVADKDKTKDPGKVVNDFAYTTGYAVTMIGKNAFEGNTSLKSVDMKAFYDLVISRNAFLDCTSLETVIFTDKDNSNIIIGNSAFAGCGFTSFVVPIGATAIGQSAFQSCPNLETVKVGYTVELIGDAAFSSCEKLTTVALQYGIRDSYPSKLTSLGAQCFLNCKSLQRIELPASVVSIGASCFSGCAALKSLNLGGVNEIPESCFSDCSELERIELPQNITAISNNCFDGCKKLKTVDWSKCKNLTTIGKLAFEDCSALESADFLENVTSIGVRAFTGCSALTSLKLSAQVKEIPDYAFYNCSGLNTITFADGSELETIGMNDGCI